MVCVLVLHILYHSLQLTYIYWHSFIKQYHIQLYIRMYFSEHSKSCWVLICGLNSIWDHLTKIQKWLQLAFTNFLKICYFSIVTFYFFLLQKNSKIYRKSTLHILHCAVVICFINKYAPIASLTNSTTGKKKTICSHECYVPGWANLHT